MHDSENIMTYTTSITSISNTLKNLLLQYNFHSSYNQTRYIGKEEIIHNIFSTYVETLFNYTNHPELVQERKLNLDDPGYKKVDATMHIPSDKKEIDNHDSKT